MVLTIYKEAPKESKSFYAYFICFDQCLPSLATSSQNIAQHSGRIVKKIRKFQIVLPRW